MNKFVCMNPLTSILDLDVSLKESCTAHAASLKLQNNQLLQPLPRHEFEAQAKLIRPTILVICRNESPSNEPTPALRSRKLRRNLTAKVPEVIPQSCV